MTLTLYIDEFNTVYTYCYLVNYKRSAVTLTRQRKCVCSGTNLMFVLA